MISQLKHFDGCIKSGFTTSRWDLLRHEEKKFVEHVDSGGNVVY